MNEARRKEVSQIIILVILLAVLGAMIYFMVIKPQQAGPPPAASRQAAAEATGQPAGGTPTAPGQAPQYGTAGTEKATAQAEGKPSAAPVTDVSGLNVAINEDQFKVFALSPPKNPFIKEERWYADSLKEQLPGYPELRDQGYFDTMDAYIPDIDKYFEEPKDWAQVNLSRQMEPQSFMMEGTSTDGSITTRLEMIEETEPPTTIAWTADSDVPLSALRTPGWYEGEVPPELRDGTDLMAAAGEEALAVPGTTATAEVQAPGDTLLLSGVNLKGAASSALLLYNGVPYLVGEGSVLPTHYQVMAIKSDGVVLLELRSGESSWVPLGGTIGAK